jgi:predicted aspartyl protease
MAVRVKILIRNTETDFEVMTVALVNTGYEVEEPEILLPRRLAEYIGLSLKPPKARVEVYETPLGLYYLVFIPKAVSVHLVDVCERVDGVNVAVSEGEREVLISDALGEALGVQLLEIGKGVWRHIRDPPGTTRLSVPAEYW